MQVVPTCKDDREELLGALKHETVALRCEVDANPPLVTFHWTFNNSGDLAEVPPSRFTSVGSVSRLNYTPVSDMDYGTLACWGSNAVGHQRAPCIFQVVAAGRPFPLINCSVVNQTSDSLHVECLESFDGGLPQSFLMELLDLPGLRPRYNVTVVRGPPVFDIYGMEPGASYQVNLYAVNAKGRSEPYVIEAVTFKGVAKFTDQEFGQLVRKLSTRLLVWFDPFESRPTGGSAYVCKLVFSYYKMSGSYGKEKVFYQPLMKILTVQGRLRLVGALLGRFLAKTGKVSYDRTFNDASHEPSAHGADSNGRGPTCGGVCGRGGAVPTPPTQAPSSPGQVESVRERRPLKGFMKMYKTPPQRRRKKNEGEEDDEIQREELNHRHLAKDIHNNQVCNMRAHKGVTASSPLGAGPEALTSATTPLMHKLGPEVATVLGFGFERLEDLSTVIDIKGTNFAVWYTSNKKKAVTPQNSSHICGVPLDVITSNLDNSVHHAKNQFITLLHFLPLPLVLGSEERETFDMNTIEKPTQE
ncbi:hypothetical protein C0J52_22443 [Blattella germanica]|nr:hypothetical protein C0J52_22443 [Blattella germanica]